MHRIEITRIDVSAEKTRKVTDYVAEEKPFHVFLNKAHYATIFCSPTNLKELAIGHLLSEGIIRTIEEIEETNLMEKEVCRVKLNPDVDLEKRLERSKLHSRVILSACGSSQPYEYSEKLPKVESDLKVKAEIVLDCVNRLNFIAETFRKTGGVHAAAIYRADGTLVAFAEDVGRHNAVDKAIGIAALGKTEFGQCFLALSGRLTGDMVYKAARVGLPMMASLAAALDSGIVIAERAGLTLVGFVRGKRMNVYSSPERILVD
jgi:FdhD protein